jgi:hypothetical protein
MEQVVLRDNRDERLSLWIDTVPQRRNPTLSSLHAIHSKTSTPSTATTARSRANEFHTHTYCIGAQDCAHRLAIPSNITKGSSLNKAKPDNNNNANLSVVEEVKMKYEKKSNYDMNDNSSDINSIATDDLFYSSPGINETT